jgi:hypothetical protein
VTTIINIRSRTELKDRCGTDTRDYISSANLAAQAAAEANGEDYLAFAQLLIAHKADMNVADAKGSSPLAQALAAAIEGPVAYALVRVTGWPSRGAVHAGLASVVATAAKCVDRGASSTKRPQFGDNKFLSCFATLGMGQMGYRDCALIVLALTVAGWPSASGAAGILSCRSASEFECGAAGCARQDMHAELTVDFGRKQITYCAAEGCYDARVAMVKAEDGGVSFAFA